MGMAAILVIIWPSPFEQIQTLDMIPHPVLGRPILALPRKVKR